ncbi:MAG: OB-fold nucleic acid binding domain-containing protein [Nanoarchaeota archaeon]|nr:OB-fold nucleic acid binding domain-containing protein [Nanoarchaeota archaeon]
MNDKKLAYLSLLSAVIGLLLLAGWSSVTPVPERAIGSLTEASLGEVVTVCGTVGGVKTNKDGHLFFSLTDDTGTINVVKFASRNKVNIENNIAVCATGEVTEYKDELELVAEGVDV